MSVSYHTTVAWSPPTPMGLVPGKFIVWHNCLVCRQAVTTDALVEHAQSHDCAAVGQEPAGGA